MRELATIALALVAFPALAGGLSPERAVELEHLVRQDCGSDLRAETLAGTELQALVQIILDGVPGTAMPPWRPLLTEGEALWIAEYLLDADK
jgi:cytochrome c55X